MNANTTFFVAANLVDDPGNELTTDCHPTPEAAIAQALHIWNLEDSVQCEAIREALTMYGEYEDFSALLTVETR